MVGPNVCSVHETLPLLSEKRSNEKVRIKWKPTETMGREKSYREPKKKGRKWFENFISE